MAAPKRAASALYHAFIEIQDRIERATFLHYRPLMGDEIEVAYIFRKAIERNSVHNLDGGRLSASLGCAERGMVPYAVPPKFRPSDTARHYQVVFDKKRPAWLNVFETPNHNMIWSGTLQAFVIEHDALSEAEFRKIDIRKQLKNERLRKRRAEREKQGLTRDGKPRPRRIGDYKTPGDTSSPRYLGTIEEDARGTLLRSPQWTRRGESLESGLARIRSHPSYRP